jgi:hypothetical protein
LRVDEMRDLLGGLLTGYKIVRSVAKARIGILIIEILKEKKEEDPRKI